MIFSNRQPDCDNCSAGATFPDNGRIVYRGLDWSGMAGRVRPHRVP
jgi:hypothetical protein